jgi:hypothetical protein
MTTIGSKFSLFRRDRPPPVPEKDVFLSPAAPGPYASSSFSRSATSVATSSVIRSMSPRSGTLDSTHYTTHPPPSASPVSVSKQNSSPARGMSILRAAIAKIPTKMPSLPKRPSNVSLATTSVAESTEDPIDDQGDDNISLPWNINVRSTFLYQPHFMILTHVTARTTCRAYGRWVSWSAAFMVGGSQQSRFLRTRDSCHVFPTTAISFQCLQYAASHS